ncbi:MAG: hypothetical protein K9K32_07485 [Halanaerobiales bacterium]|nr:hypothetical protein [Halanaerobiales bacterium]
MKIKLSSKYQNMGIKEFKNKVSKMNIYDLQKTLEDLRRFNDKDKFVQAVYNELNIRRPDIL